MKRFAPVLLLLLLAGCADANLNKVSKALVVTAKTNGEIQTAATTAYDVKLLSENNARIVLEMCQKVNLAGKEATALTRSINKLDAPSKAQILSILNPVITAVNNTLNIGLKGITDQGTLDKIRLLLLSLQSSLNGIQLIAAGGA
jgi:hypothetical protein